MKKITRDPITGRVRVQTVNDQPSKTQQQFKEQCDVNHILEKYKRVDLMNIDVFQVTTHLSKRQGKFADLTELPSYQDALHIVRDAQNTFADLPSAVRKRFSNDPQELMDFLSDDKNTDEAIRLGLVNPKPPPSQDDPILTELKNLNQNLKSKPKQTKTIESDGGD